jgi:cytidine diphosphoramidate kinase
MVVWLVGMSGVGKTTIGNNLYEQASLEFNNVVKVDGDIIRSIFHHENESQSYTIESRYKNAKRIQEICLWLDNQGIHVICSILCIFPELLKENISLFSNYYEVYLDAAIEELERRDTKGFYVKAKAGLIKDFVGFDINFPIPENSNLNLRTDQGDSVTELSELIYEKIKINLK